MKGAQTLLNDIIQAVPRSDSPGCRLPILRSLPLDRTGEPISARLALRNSNGNIFQPLPGPSTSDRGTSVQDERKRQTLQFHQGRACHPATRLGF